MFKQFYLPMNLKLMLVDSQDFLLASGARVCKSCDYKKLLLLEEEEEEKGPITSGVSAAMRH